MSKHLPDPWWGDAPAACIACGYSLVGLTPPGRCPECGLPFERRCLVLAGVPRRSVNSPWRRAAWVLLIAYAAVYFQVVVALAIVSWKIALAGLGLLVGGSVWLLATNPRERRGTERFVITPAGMARVPLESAETLPQLMFVPWTSRDGIPADSVELSRVSSVWRKLRIGTADDRGRGRLRFSSVCFEAGVRCPEDQVEPVLATIREFIATPPLPSPPPEASARVAAPPE